MCTVKLGRPTSCPWHTTGKRHYIFRFAEDYAETLVFRRKAMLEATEPLMSENGIPRSGIHDVPAVWNGKVAKN